jgi:hypothetical protein|tara:strand:- start:13938 stop:15137 length:1200 start_codon:yes stop_codon:yes gene_type:complete
MSNENLGDAITSIVEGVSDEAEAQDETLEVAVEATEEEVVAEQSTESEEVSEEEVSEEEVEGVAEAKVKEEDDEEDEDEVEEVAKPSIPKTKAGVINAAVEMLKKAKKHEAQQLFAKMVAMDEAEDDGSVKKAINVVKPEKDKSIKAKSSDASPKQESADWEDDLDVIVANEATLSDGFREKAGAIFEAAYTQKVGAEIDRLESEYAQNLETEVTDVQNEIVEKVDSYLNYVVENWMKENEVAVQQGLRTEIAEEFMSSLQSVFKEHYIEVPEGKADLIDDLADQVSELEEQLNKSTEDNIRLNDKAQSYERAEIVRKQSSGLADTEAEKLAGLVEDIDFEDEETFEMKVKTVKESYFKTEPEQSTDESDALVGKDSGAQVPTSDTMTAYTQAISKHNQ